MKEQGVVTRIISPNLAEVAFQRNETCAKCRACHEVGQGMVGIEAINEIGAKRDDMVEIEIPSEEIVKGSVVVFLIPLFFLVAGYLIGSSLMRFLGLMAWEEGVGVLAGIISLLLGFAFVRWYDQSIRQREALRARIIKISSSP